MSDIFGIARLVRSCAEQADIVLLNDRRGSVRMLLQQVPPTWFAPGGPSDEQDSPSIWNRSRLNLHKCAPGLGIGDLLGSVFFSAPIFDIYAESPQHANKQLWTAVGGIVMRWGPAAHSQQPYGRATLLGSLRKQLLCCVWFVVLTFELILLLAFSSKLIGGFSRIWLLAWMAALTLAWRRHLHILLARGWCLDRALMLTGFVAMGGATRTDDGPGNIRGVRFVATAPLPGLPDGSSLDWVEEKVRTERVDRVSMICFDNATEETNTLLTRLSHLAIQVTRIPSLEGIKVPVLHVEHIGMRALADLNLLPLSALQAPAKRVQDLVVASLAFALLLPLFGLLGLAIKLDCAGPVFFRQWRTGFHVKPGITEWAQVCGCSGEIDSHNKLRKRVAPDCYYIEHWSIGFDIWIMWRTVAALLFDNDAY